MEEVGVVSVKLPLTERPGTKDELPARKIQTAAYVEPPVWMAFTGGHVPLGVPESNFFKHAANQNYECNTISPWSQNLGISKGLVASAFPKPSIGSSVPPPTEGPC